jgi:hypothetical protein
VERDLNYGDYFRIFKGFEVAGKTVKGMIEKKEKD